jgi:predicted lipoprotein with Yx(FWY)xxD motif
MCAAAVTVTVVAMFAAMALAASSAAPTVGPATNAKFGEKIVVDAHGRTLYALSPETAHHLLCKGRECLKRWPPLTVPSSKTKLAAGPGVRGHLGILRRSGGMLQVTLGGLPLYHFSGDRATGAANGENVHSFGGTWHAISAATNASPAPAATETETTPTPTTPTTTTPPSEKYGY